MYIVNEDIKLKYFKFTDFWDTTEARGNKMSFNLHS